MINKAQFLLPAKSKKRILNKFFEVKNQDLYHENIYIEYYYFYW